MDLLSFIRTADPTKVRIGERERNEGEPKLLETTVGRVVPLLPVAHDRSSDELEASVDKLFDEGGSGEQTDQGDSAGGGHGVGVQLVDVSAENATEDVAPAELQRRKKRKTKVVDAGEPSHPVKKLRGDYAVPGVPAVGGKSQSAVQRLLAGAVQHAEVRGGVMPTLPFVSSSVSTTPEREGEEYTELLAAANLSTLESPQRTFVPIMMNATTATPTADPAAIAKERLVSSSVFGGDSSSAGGSHPISGGFSDRTGADFLVGGIRTVVDPDSNLQRVHVPHWNVTSGFCMDDSGVCRETVDEFAPPKFFTSILGMEHDQLFTEFNVGEARQISLGAEEAEATEVVHLRNEVQALKERNTNLEKEKSELEVKVTDLAASDKVGEQEVANLDVVVSSVKLQNDSLADQDEKIKEVNEKFDKLCVDFVDMALHLEENFYPHLLTTIFEHRWLLTHGMKLAIAQCLNFTEYISALGVTIGKAIEKEADYLSALQRLQSVNFPLIAELKTNKDASVEVIINLLRLEDALPEKLGLVESQPHVDQLMVPIHHSPDQRVVALRGVFVPLSEPLSAMALEGTEGTFGVSPDTTTALSITSISASTIPPISTDDYEIAHTEGGEGAVADEGADPFLDTILLSIIIRSAPQSCVTFLEPPLFE
nr:hypothetical protein [Tanacetum cinerariifolium]